MKNRILLLTLIISFVFFLCGCSDTKPVKESRFLLDTIVDITLYGKNRSTVMDELFAQIMRLESKYSRHKAGSEIATINSNPGKPAHVSEDTMEMIRKSLYFSSISNGLFDISIGPLVDLWNINGDDPHVPSQNEIDKALEKIDYRSITIDEENSTVSLTKNEMSIDLGAIAKGYITDKLVTLLEEKGVNSALLNLGGNLYLYGSKPDGTPWNIGIRNPYGMQGEYIGMVSVTDRSIVTSGIYERFFEEDGNRYHHILNPKTGYPGNNSLASVSIISPQSTLADGLSTTVFLLGQEKGMALIEGMEDVEAIMVTEDKKVYLSPGIKSGNIPFQLTDADYTLCD